MRRAGARAPPRCPPADRRKAGDNAAPGAGSERQPGLADVQVRLSRSSRGRAPPRRAGRNSRYHSAPGAMLPPGRANGQRKRVPSATRSASPSSRERRLRIPPTAVVAVVVAVVGEQRDAQRQACSGGCGSGCRPPGRHRSYPRPAPSRSAPRCGGRRLRRSRPEGAVEVEAVDANVARRRDVAAAPAIGEQRPGRTAVDQGCIGLGEDEPAAERRIDRRDQQPMIAPRQAAGDGAGRIAAAAVGEPPFAALGLWRSPQIGAGNRIEGWDRSGADLARPDLRAWLRRRLHGAGGPYRAYRGFKEKAPRSERHSGSNRRCRESRRQARNS